MWKACSLSLLILFLLSGCMKSEDRSGDNYYFSLTGESETWSVDGYELMIQGDRFQAGNGTITAEKEEEIIAYSFDMEVHTVHDGNDTIIHRTSSTGKGQDISQSETGRIEGSETIVSKNAEQLEHVYMLIAWRQDGEDMEEKIVLYDEEERIHN